MPFCLSCDHPGVRLHHEHPGIGKIQRHPLQVKTIHKTVGVPLKYFPLLASCEFAGALG